MLWFAAAGSAQRGMSRLLRGTYLHQKTGSTFPVGTLLINISGSFLLGLLLRYSPATQAISPDVTALLTTGFCGGYTTFSTFSYESLALLREVWR